MPFGHTEGFIPTDIHRSCNGDLKHSNHQEKEEFLPHENGRRKDVKVDKKFKETKETNKLPNEKVDVVVQLYDNPGCSKRWTNREKYLLCICSLLFFACVAFIIVAFIRDKETGKYNELLKR